jgi:hypothetical protein
VDGHSEPRCSRSISILPKQLRQRIKNWHFDTGEALETVVDKWIRGLQFCEQGRPLQADETVSVFFVDDATAHEAFNKILHGAKRVQKGPGVEVLIWDVAEGNDFQTLYAFNIWNHFRAYRKGKIKSSWIARFLTKSSGYKKSNIAIADDVQDSDGVAVLSFSQAQEAARSWFQAQTRLDRGISAIDGYTISNALDDYLEDYRGRGAGHGTVGYGRTATTTTRLHSAATQKFQKSSCPSSIWYSRT